MANRPISDWRKASKSFQVELLAQGKTVSKAAESILLFAGEEFLRSAEAQPKSLVPYYTGNLMDSIGVRVLQGNRLVGYRTMVETTTQHALKPQRMVGVNGDIWGEVELMKRIMRPSRRVRQSLVAQMIVGVPYAGNVGQSSNTVSIVGFSKEINIDYFEELSKLFSSKMEQYTQLLAKYPKMKLVQ